MNNKYLIIEIATKLLSEYGTAQFSAHQIANTSRLTLREVTAQFPNKTEIIDLCLQNAVECMTRTVISANYARGYNSVLDLWHLLVQYNFVHVAEGKLISLYLRSPSQFPYVNIKSSLLRMLNEKTELLHDKFFDSCEAIRLIALSYLIQMAAVYTLSHEAEGSRELRENYFVSHVKSHFESLLILPIY